MVPRRHGQPQGATIGHAHHCDVAAIYRELAAWDQGRQQKLGVTLRGSWDLVSRAISTLTEVISRYNYSHLIYNPTY